MHDTRHPWKARRMLRDIASCDEFPEASAALGFVPSSEDVERREHGEAHFRRESIGPLMNAIREHAHTVGDLLHALNDEDADPDAFHAIALRSAVGVISHLVDSGRLAVLP